MIKVYSLSSVLPGLPNLHFICEHVHCPSCSGSLVVKKVKTRSVFIAGYGSVKVKEYMKQCRSCYAWHGNSKVNKDLIYLPEEIALIENLSNQAY
jgi:hypothetical protein